MLRITERINIPLSEVSITQIRAQGAGGQNVNKVSSAVHIRFDIHRSSLPETVKENLLKLHDSRITKGGEIILKAQNYRSYEQNKEDGLVRLGSLIRCALQPRKKRRPTRPSKASQHKRLDTKTRHGRTKQLRKKIQ